MRVTALNYLNKQSRLLGLTDSRRDALFQSLKKTAGFGVPTAVLLTLQYNKVQVLSNRIYKSPLQYHKQNEQLQERRKTTAVQWFPH